MAKAEFKDEVERGIVYLDATYPGWWNKIDLTTLAACSNERSVLCQVTGKLAYDTDEFKAWTFAEQRSLGFLPPPKRNACPTLSAEWTFRIRHLKDERKDWSEQ